MKTVNPHKYFAFINDRGYWDINELLPTAQIDHWLKLFGSDHRASFVSMQDYDQYGSILGCPLFFDFDGDKQKVLNEVKEFVGYWEFIFNITPIIYFSGSKGFHLFINKYIAHPKCHLINKYFAKLTDLSTLDHQVYRTNALMRIKLTKGYNRNFYKIQITRNELFSLTFEQIEQIATQPRTIEVDHDIEKLDIDLFEDHYNTALTEIESNEYIESDSAAERDYMADMTPCIKTLLTEGSGNGMRHNTILILAAHFKNSGISETKCLETITSYPHWGEYDRNKSVRKVVFSVYNSTKPIGIGCSGSSETAGILKTFCAKPCHFRDDYERPTFS